ncbi:unnamed protein product [Rotaria sp. Silwood2]|nr:unnamed protein product [Rotaria sp. Silwood2]
MKYTVKDCDPATSLPDDERYADEFMFDINNSLYDQLLEKVSVQMDRATKWFQFVHYTPYPLIKCNDIGTSYTLVKLPDDSSAVTPCVRLRSNCDAVAAQLRRSFPYHALLVISVHWTKIANYMNIICSCCLLNASK